MRSFKCHETYRGLEFFSFYHPFCLLIGELQHRADDSCQGLKQRTRCASICVIIFIFYIDQAFNPLHCLLVFVIQVQLHSKFAPSLRTLKVLVTTTDAQWEGTGDVGLARYEPALLPPCPTIRVLSYSS